jgi:hypothetical protein
MPSPGEPKLSAASGRVFQQPPGAQLAILHLGEPDDGQCALLVIGQAEVRAGGVAEDRDTPVMRLSDNGRIDHIMRIRRRVSGPRLGIAHPAANRFLAEYHEFVIVGHQLAQTVNVTAIDAVDETDHSRGRRQPLAAHASNVTEAKRLKAEAAGVPFWFGV